MNTNTRIETRNKIHAFSNIQELETQSEKELTVIGFMIVRTEKYFEIIARFDNSTMHLETKDFLKMLSLVHSIYSHAFKTQNVFVINLNEVRIEESELVASYKVEVI